MPAQPGRESPIWPRRWRWRRAHKRVRFVHVTELITQLMEAHEERELARLDLLVPDELGYVPASKLGAKLLFDVISTAYERTSLIITTNLPFEQ